MRSIYIFSIIVLAASCNHHNTDNEIRASYDPIVKTMASMRAPYDINCMDSSIQSGIIKADIDRFIGSELYVDYVIGATGCNRSITYDIECSNNKCYFKLLKYK